MSRANGRKIWENYTEKLTEFRTAPKKLPPPTRKTDLQVWAAAAQISKLETKTKAKGMKTKEERNEENND